MTIKGTVRNGIIYPDTPLTEWEGQEVTITVTSAHSDAPTENGLERLLHFLETTAMETGIPDLAENHDAYAHGGAVPAVND